MIVLRTGTDPTRHSYPPSVIAGVSRFPHGAVGGDPVHSEHPHLEVPVQLIVPPLAVDLFRLGDPVGQVHLHDMPGYQDPIVARRGGTSSVTEAGSAVEDRIDIRKANSSTAVMPQRFRWMCRLPPSSHPPI